MTREEAINALRCLITMPGFTANEALDMAIAALREQSRPEASNQQVTESLWRNGSGGSEEAPASKNQVTSDKTSDKNSNAIQHDANTSNALGGWISVKDGLPPEGERVLNTDGAFVGEMYINKRGKWQRYNVNDSALLMALDILWWMPMPKPPEVG